MFTLNEQKLRAALAEGKEGNEPEGYGWVSPFDPIGIDADELHRIVDDCLERGIIEKADERAMMAVYPLSISDPEPLLSVNPGDGPMLLGGAIAVTASSDDGGDPVADSLAVLGVMVDAANALFRESERAKASSKEPGTGPEEFIRLIYTEEDVRQWAEESEGAVGESEALQRAREWGSNIQDTVARLCSEQLMGAVLDDQP